MCCGNGADSLLKLAPVKISEMDSEIALQEYLDPKNWKFAAGDTENESSNNGLIMLFLEKLCKYSPEILGIEDIETSVLGGTMKNDELPTMEELKKGYSTIRKICGHLTKNIGKDLAKEKLALFKVLCFCL